MKFISAGNNAIRFFYYCPAYQKCIIIMLLILLPNILLLFALLLPSRSLLALEVKKQFYLEQSYKELVQDYVNLNNLVKQKAKVNLFLKENITNFLEDDFTQSVKEKNHFTKNKQLKSDLFTETLIKSLKSNHLKLMAAKPTKVSQINQNEVVLELSLLGNDVDFFHWLWVISQEKWLWQIYRADMKSEQKKIQIDLIIGFYLRSEI